MAHILNILFRNFYFRFGYQILQPIAMTDSMTDTASAAPVQENTIRQENTHPQDTLRLLGLDFGSTTSSMMLAEVRVGRHSLDGRMGFSEPRMLLQSEPVFTPFTMAELLDESRINALLDEWLSAADWRSDAAPGQPDIQVAGAALITGLAARSENVQLLTDMISRRLGNSLIATADDPGLESWLAFMGSCATLSRHHSTRALINLDIGGGTTNPAQGLNGQVFDCGCFYIGARHLTFVPGTYTLLSFSSFGSLLLQYLGCEKQPGDTLNTDEVDAVVNFYVTALEFIALGDMSFFQRSPLHKSLLQMPFTPAANAGTHPLITFSGGVGEIIYQHERTGEWPAQTCYGDLGVVLAQGIIASPLLAADLRHQPEHAGRATVMGLTLHSCDVSGSSLYLSDPGRLPLNDLPIISRLPANTEADGWHRAVRLAMSSVSGACISIEDSRDILPQGIKTLAHTIRNALDEARYPLTQPLVLLMDSNLGKALGQYITDWGKENRCLYVIDEVPLRDARFVQIGKPYQHIVPVSFFGMN
ncbi:MAG: reactivating factor for ethanolamine ammonia lyase [Oceanospirillaceae bacterium]|nr:reactivating factor for ethanolamine ammonia lyase [Oceanospirillaceae bacterium]MBL34662.1 reactivating factor for ethanolamine ammonia lyase [Oceanospirillaceae bacterium]MBS52468.1 reactivating factor for ethanolamine ammonia lyase [Oceanospirillaceae bacterium]